jgi:hypothetical protein
VTDIAQFVETWQSMHCAALLSVPVKPLGTTVSRPIEESL